MLAFTAVHQEPITHPVSPPETGGGENSTHTIQQGTKISFAVIFNRKRLCAGRTFPKPSRPPRNYDQMQSDETERPKQPPSDHVQRVVNPVVDP